MNFETIKHYSKRLDNGLIWLEFNRLALDFKLDKSLVNEDSVSNLIFKGFSEIYPRMNSINIAPQLLKIYNEKSFKDLLMRNIIFSIKGAKVKNNYPTTVNRSYDVGAFELSKNIKLRKSQEEKCNAIFL